MDSLITAAARALAAGDPLGALKRVALRDDPPALALRGIALAQLGDLARARELLRRAARAFGPREAVARARCVVAEAEIDLAARDLGRPPQALDAARRLLAARGDAANAAHAGLLEIRRLLLIGRLDAAERALRRFDPAPLTAASRAACELAVAAIAVRRLRTHEARAALSRAQAAASRAAMPALLAEVDVAARVLEAPAARLLAGGRERMLTLGEVETLLASDRLVVDACRYVVRRGGTIVSLASRPILFGLARALAEAWPGDVSRAALLGRVFRARETDDSHRARLRVEIGRLRRALAGLAGLAATAHGYVLHPAAAAANGRRGAVAVLAPPADEDHGAVLALLSDGEAWSSSALALALGTSQRTVQRALDDLAARARVRAVGQGRGRRWTMPPLPGFTTPLLLPAVPPAP